MRCIILLAVLAVVAYAGPVAIDKKAGMAYREKAVMDGLFCAICKPIVEEAEEVGMEFSDEFMKKLIQTSCDSVGFFKQMCIKQMEQVAGEMETYIKQKFAPEVCCKNVGLCD